MSEVFIGIGSNQGDAVANCRRAVELLNELPDTELVSVSSLYSSKPHGYQQQPDFVNAVVKMTSTLTASMLLSALMSIENQLQRQRLVRFGPRTIDLDILLFDDLELNTEQLTIPHYALKSREFVLYPLHEIAPDLVFPDGEALAAVLARCPRNGLQCIGEMQVECEL